MILRGVLAYVVLATTVITHSQTRPFEPLDVFKLKRVLEVATSPDGSHVAYTVNIERPFEEGPGSDYRELHVLDVATGVSTPYITGTNDVHGVQWKPDGTQITFTGKLGEAKTNTLYGINLSGGTWFPIVELPGASNYAWNPKGESIAYVADEPSTTDPREARMKKQYERMGFNAEVFEERVVNKALYVYDLAAQKAVQWSRSGSVFGFVWSPEGDRIAAQIAPRNLVDDSYMFKDIYILNTSGQLKLVDAPGKLGDMAWSTDGKYLAFTAAVDVNDPASGNLYALDADKPTTWKEIRNYTEGFEGTVNSVFWKDDKTMVYVSDESIDRTLREVKVSGGASTLVIKGGDVVVGATSFSNGLLAFGGNTWRHPDDLFTYDFRRSISTRHTVLNPWLDSMSFGKQERFAWTAQDGTPLEGFIIYPANYQPGTRYPLVTYVHGGPEACVTNGWFTGYSTWGQLAASQDMFVFAPNYRSSTGRGVAFSKLGQKDLADEEFTDILDGIDKLVADGKVDRNRVGIGGGSYGGYFSAWAATRHSDRFAAAVCFVGIGNQISKRNTTDIPYEDYYVHWLIWSNEDIQLMYDRSPVKWASNNKTPTLILHGKDDPRVHPSQSLELYRTLKMQGKAPVRLVWYPGEGHGNRNNPAQLDYAIRTLEWFTFYLKESHAPGEMPAADLDYGVEPSRGEATGRPDRGERPTRERGDRPERDPNRPRGSKQTPNQPQSEPQVKPGG
jgi:dipeptidyl aminopeptidase/acylaminoacyl peptidase